MFWGVGDLSPYMYTLAICSRSLPNDTKSSNMGPLSKNVVRFTGTGRKILIISTTT